MTVSAESLGFLTPAQLKAQQLEQQQTGSATGSALNTPQNPIAQNNTPTIAGTIPNKRLFRTKKRCI